MPPARIIALTSLALVAFAGNSILCRLALRGTAIDAATFTTVRLLSGAVVLAAVVRWQRGSLTRSGSWSSAAALAAYAVGFSLAYVELTASTGALLLFGAVQATMITHALACGERMRGLQIVGLAAAVVGLMGLLIPGLTAPPPGAAALMLAAGIAWGVYSILGKRAGDPSAVTAGNFSRSVPMVLVVNMFLRSRFSIDTAGLVYAIASGALTSGIGYVIWYSALPALRATTAATVQLLVPVLAAIAGVLLLREVVTLRLVLATIAIVGGIALVVRTAPRRAS